MHIFSSSFRFTLTLAAAIQLGAAAAILQNPSRFSGLEPSETPHKPATCCLEPYGRYRTLLDDSTEARVNAECINISDSKDHFATFACSQGLVFHRRDGHFLSFTTPLDSRPYSIVVQVHAHSGGLITSRPIHCDASVVGKPVHYGKEIFGREAKDVEPGYRVQVFNFEDGHERSKCARVHPDTHEA